MFSVGRTWYVGLLSVMTGHALGRAGRLLWEDVVYGASEGMLLSVLPVLTVWQALERLGWGHRVGRQARDRRTRAWREPRRDRRASPRPPGFRGRDLIFLIAGCLWFSLAYVLTASPLAATVGHMGLHAGIGANGMQLPPYRETGGIPEVPRVSREAA